jgi:protein TonB
LPKSALPPLPLPCCCRPWPPTPPNRPPRLESADCSTPSYRAAWQDDDLQGTVRLAVLVGTDGSVQEAKVVESSGYRALDKASLRAGTTCKFEPASKDSANAAVWAVVQYKWVLN